MEMSRDVTEPVTLNETTLIPRLECGLPGALLNPPPRPLKWTADLVGDRLLEATRTLYRMPMSIRPSGLKTLWPIFQAMTERETRNLIFEAEAAGTQRELYASRNKVRIPPSAAEIERMEEAIGWVPRYLKGDVQAAMTVSGWVEDWRRNNELAEPVYDALNIISRGLNGDCVRVR